MNYINQYLCDSFCVDIYCDHLPEIERRLRAIGNKALRRIVIRKADNMIGVFKELYNEKRHNV